ncbi:hypothetical protein ACH4YO_00475 [Streptomyces noursei]|uniref:hypothetical protein n=1 Tax=Streptomyces noursei TaxID=1971 RepID=UPI0033E2741C
MAITSITQESPGEGLILSVIALLGLAGAFLAMGARGPLKRLGWPIAAISLGAVLLAVLMGPMASLVAISAYGVVVAVVPPFAYEAHKARSWWFLAVLLAEACLTACFAVGGIDMIALWLMLFGPGALVAAAQLVSQLRQRNSG